MGDTAKGFAYKNEYEHHFLRKVLKDFDGVEGTIVDIDPINDLFQIRFEKSSNVNGGEFRTWWYPLGEYLERQREERLKELGIL